MHSSENFSPFLVGFSELKILKNIFHAKFVTIKHSCTTDEFLFWSLQHFQENKNETSTGSKSEFQFHISSDLFLSHRSTLSIDLEFSEEEESLLDDKFVRRSHDIEGR